MEFGSGLPLSNMNLALPVSDVKPSLLLRIRACGRQPAAIQLIIPPDLHLFTVMGMDSTNALRL